jgi:hypothetical protein
VLCWIGLHAPGKEHQNESQIHEVSLRDQKASEHSSKKQKFWRKEANDMKVKMKVARVIGNL